MGIQVRWDTDSRVPAQTVIYWEGDEQWTWNDFRRADSTSMELTISVEHTVHILADFIKTQNFPLQGAISGFNRAISNTPPNRGHVVVVTENRALKAIDPVLRLLNPKAMENIHRVDTLDEAYDILMRYID